MKVSIFQRPSARSYRVPMPVREALSFFNGDIYPLCPQCRETIDRDYQRYCDRCGQRLNWKKYREARMVRTVSLLET